MEGPEKRDNGAFKLSAPRPKSPALADPAAFRGTRGPDARARGCGGCHRIVFFLSLYLRVQLRVDES